MSDKNNHNNDLPDWLKDFEPEDDSSEKNQNNDGKDRLSNDDWLSSLSEDLEKEKKEQEWTEEEKSVLSKDRGIDSTQEFLYEIENMIDDRSYLNLGDRAEHVADGNDWKGWDNESSDADNDEWLSSFSFEGNLSGDEKEEADEPVSAFSEEVSLDDPFEQPSNTEGQKAINLDATPDWLKDATNDEEDSVIDSFVDDFLNGLSNDVSEEQSKVEENPFNEEESQALENVFAEKGHLEEVNPASQENVFETDNDGFSIAENTGKNEDLPDWLQDIPTESNQVEATSSQNTNAAFDLSAFEEDGLSEDNNAEDDLPDWLKDSVEEDALEQSKSKPSTDIFAGADISDTQDVTPANSEHSLFSQNSDASQTPKPVTDSLSEELEEEALSVMDSFSSISDDALDEIDLFDSDIDLEDDLETTDENKNVPFSEEMPSLNRSEMPAWMNAIRPSDVKEESREELIASQPEVKIGPLAGLRGVIPAEPEVVSFANPANPEGSLQVTNQQSAFASLLEELFDGSAEQAKPKNQKVTNHKRGWLLVPLLLVAALLAANFVNVPQINAPMTPANQSFADVITSLPTEANVLFVLDYQLGVYQELHTGLNNLMIEMDDINANVYTITTKPMGNGLGNMLIDDYPSVSIIPLGYLTGNASAISQFAYDLSVAPNADLLPITLRQLNHFDAIILLTDGINNLQNWAEQAGPALPDAPLLVLSSAKIKPIVASYYQTSPQRVDGYLSGYFESITYQKYLLPNISQNTETWDAVYLVTITVIVLLMIGSTVSLMGNLLEGLRKERKEKK